MEAKQRFIWDIAKRRSIRISRIKEFYISQQSESVFKVTAVISADEWFSVSVFPSIEEARAFITEIEGKE